VHDVAASLQRRARINTPAASYRGCLPFRAKTKGDLRVEGTERGRGGG